MVPRRSPLIPQVSRFTKANGLDFEGVSSEEKGRVSNELRDVMHASTPQHGLPGVAGFDVTPFYKIPFTQALDLVAKRHVSAGAEGV